MVEAAEHGRHDEELKHAEEDIMRREKRARSTRVIAHAPVKHPETAPV